LPLLDEMAIAACMACVDLNPVRVALAETAEASAFTSVQDCVIDRQSALSAASPDVADQQAEHGPQAGRLAGSGGFGSSAKASARAFCSAASQQSGLSADVTGSVRGSGGLDRASVTAR